MTTSVTLVTQPMGRPGAPMDPTAIEQLPMPATYARHLTRRFAPEALFAGTGIRIEDLDDGSPRITVRQAIRYVQNAIALADQGDWYLAWAGKLSDHFHGPMSLALSSAPALGEGVDAFVRYFPSRIPYMHMGRRQDDNEFCVEMEPLITLGEATALLVETPLLILARHLESVYDVDLREARLELAYPPPPYADRYRSHFHCEVRFDTTRNALHIPVAWRALGNLGFIESSWAHAVSQCEAMMGSSRDRATLSDVREVLCHVFEDPDRKRPLPTLNEVAEALHITPRTVIRRLRRIGTTYQQITDDFLRTRAQEMLVNDELSVKEVASALGFDNPANFGKAFKRWCGISPGGYRRAHVRSDRDV